MPYNIMFQNLIVVTLNVIYFVFGIQINRCCLVVYPYNGEVSFSVQRCCLVLYTTVLPRSLYNGVVSFSIQRCCLVLSLTALSLSLCYFAISYIMHDVTMSCLYVHFKLVRRPCIGGNLVFRTSKSDF